MHDARKSLQGAQGGVRVLATEYGQGLSTGRTGTSSLSLCNFLCGLTPRYKFRSIKPSFEPICEQVTKDECMKTRAALSTPLPGICDRVHFRPLIRPHTDSALGHCSYLNTCYSEPTYAQSPSIPPLPSAQGQMNPQWPKAQLPSGLGAGGRGKEKAPCRYLHYEIDWDAGDAGSEAKWEDRPVKKPHRLALGHGPNGAHEPPVSWASTCVRIPPSYATPLS